jgi:hypothetical protein
MGKGISSKSAAIPVPYIQDYRVRDGVAKVPVLKVTGRECDNR